jgi:large subunit ribosomal protein L21
MYAIVQVGGRQYRAAPGERLVVDRLDVEPGSRVHLSDVRMLIAEEGDKSETQIGRPRLDDVAVAARAVSHFRGPKILVFKYKPKKRYRRHQGFRAELTELRIEEVRLGAYQDSPASEPAKKRTTARGGRPAAQESAEVAPKPTVASAKASVRSSTRARRGPAKSEAATAPAKVKTASVAKPKAPRATRRSAASAAVPTEEKKPKARAKAEGKSEKTDGS